MRITSVRKELSTYLLRTYIQLWHNRKHTSAEIISFFPCWHCSVCMFFESLLCPCVIWLAVRMEPLTYMLKIYIHLWHNRKYTLAKSSFVFPCWHCSVCMLLWVLAVLESSIFLIIFCSYFTWSFAFMFHFSLMNIIFNLLFENYLLIIAPVAVISQIPVGPWLKTTMTKNCLIIHKFINFYYEWIVYIANKLHIIYIYKTENFETPTIFHVSIIFK